MLSMSFIPRTVIALLIPFIPRIFAQAVAGGAYIAGGGVPGASPYRIVDEYKAPDFFSKFAFYNSYDPTYGHVQYVNESVAETNGYVQVTDFNTVLVKPDTTNLWPRGGPGRPSVRITSKNTYFHGLFVLDLVHMPWGCGTWPAYWLLGPDWPYTGEIDIIEGVNTDQNNTISLHTGLNCTIAGSGQTGTFKTDDCYAYANDNSGCGTLLDISPANNYGSNFNANQGGVYVTEWTSRYIKHWFFSRGNIPESIANGSPNVSTFGLPAVNAQGNCDIDSHFQNMSIIINIDFCGAWAGNVYRNHPSCPQNPDRSVSALDSCVDFVGNNPSQLSEAYFEINSLQVYQMPDAIQTSSTYSTSIHSVTTGLASTNTILMGQGAPTTASSYAVTLAYTGPLSSSSLASSLATPLSASTSFKSKSSIFSITSSGISTYMSISSTPTSYIISTSATQPATSGPISASMSRLVMSSSVSASESRFITSSGSISSSTTDMNATDRFTASALPSDSLSVMPTYSTTLFVSTEITSTTIVTSANNREWTTSASEAWMVGSTTLASATSFQSIWSDVEIDMSNLPASADTSASLAVSIGATSAMIVPLTSNSGAFDSSKLYSKSSELGGTFHSPSATVISPSGTAAPATSTLSLASDETLFTSSSTCSSMSSKVPQCPRGTALDLCRIYEQTNACSSSRGSVYMLACGKAWTGTVTWDSQTTKQAMEKRGIAPNFGTCQTACDSTASCVAISYIGTNCTLFSQVTGLQPYPGAVTAAKVPSNEPSCPRSAGSTFTDTTGVLYTIGCYASYAGNDVGNPIFKPTLSECLRSCDTQSICIGVEYDMSQNYCYLKSSFPGPEVSSFRRMIAWRSSSQSGFLTATEAVIVTLGSSTTTLSLSSGQTITETPVTTVTETLPPRGFFTTIASGATSSSYYVYTTMNVTNSDSSDSFSLCMTCGLTPTVVTNPSDLSSPSLYSNIGNSIITVTQTIMANTCPITRSGTGTTTFFTTHTMTSCGRKPVCPSSISSSTWPLSTGTTQSGYMPSSSSILEDFTHCTVAQGSTFTSYLGVQYDILCDTVFTDSTIDTLRTTQLADCLLSCDMYNLRNRDTSTVCRGVSWMPEQETSNCAIKNGSTRARQVGTNSGRLLISPMLSGNDSPSPGTNGGSGVPGYGTDHGPGHSAGLGTGSSTESGPGVPVTIVRGGPTALSMYATASGSAASNETNTIIYGDSTVMSTAYRTESSGFWNGGTGGLKPAYGPSSDGSVPEGSAGPSGGSSGLSTGHSTMAYIPSTVFGVSTAYSHFVSNQVTHTEMYGVKTIITVSYVPATTKTITTTTVSVSVSTIVSTAYQYSTIISNGVTTVVSKQILVTTAQGVTITQAGPTITQNGPTVTQAGPTVTASQGIGVVTVTKGTGGSDAGGVVTVTAPPQTVTSFIYPSSRSSLVSYCRTTSTNHLNGALPAKLRRRSLNVMVQKAQPGAELMP